MRQSDPEYEEPYGAYGGVSVNEGFVCDLWEERKVDEPC